MDDKSFEKNSHAKKRSDDWIEITLHGIWKTLINSYSERSELRLFGSPNLQLHFWREIEIIFFLVIFEFRVKKSATLQNLQLGAKFQMFF